MTDTHVKFHSPPSDIKLTDGFIDIWLGKLDQPDETIQSLMKSLSNSEINRAVKYRLDRDKNRFIVGRGILRDIIGRYLNMEPHVINFQYGKFGKPYLPDSYSDKKIKFNLAHSRGIAIYAFVSEKEIGVDVECVREMPDVDYIADSFFSSPEVSALRSVSEDQKQEAFFNCWTRKEAYIKALGDGLTHSLDQFSVSLIPGEEPKILEIKNSPNPEKWSLRAFKTEDNYIAAVAVENCKRDMRFWKWKQ
ncbi:4'-phosphopantetheinyl transferase superfamily protein [Candidatus Poribacteria bacterium]|nr:4'-phosphopantetheinyl transferase superfamily protein [Candidatus Poribacteria bacterium]